MISIKNITTIIIFLISLSVFGQVAPNKYRLVFTDKNNTPYSINSPDSFLSQRAIDRRTKQGISIVENDLPVDPAYVDSLKNLGLTVLNTSKWFNSATVYTTDTALIDTITNISFIASKSKILTKKHKQNIKYSENKLQSAKKTKAINSYYNYGYSANQINMLNGQELHNNGFRGQGMLIAVTDAGFFKVDSLPAFDSLWTYNKIIAVKDFVNNNSNIFAQSSHGMQVLSLIASNIDGTLIGSAPMAEYMLLRTEDTGSEYNIEEDNWVAAAEYADSMGVDIINISLGYETFDDPAQNYTYNDMDGNTALITRGADIAASKGILVVVSAGNSGDTPWHYIGAPADADSVLTVGSVGPYETYSSFSSTGPSADNRVKPNISAQGGQVAIQNTSGGVSLGYGTSFSAPIITGLAACLWQANPNLTNMQIIDFIEKSADQYNNPDSLKGYGIPDFALANLLIQNVENEGFSISSYCRFYPNPFNDEICIEFLSADSQVVAIEIFDLLGKIIFNETFKTHTTYNKIIINNLANIDNGTYIIKLTTETGVQQEKIMKN